MATHRKIYTKYGDEGETSLLYGGRVSKNNPHTEAYGITDEAVSAMGLARALSDDKRVRETLRQLQREMFTVGAELATDPARYDLYNKHFQPVTADMVSRLEDLIDGLEETVQMPPVFILPGASAASAALDLARCMIRTSERRTVALKEAGGLTNTHILHYLNRLGDLLFILARFQDRDLPLEAVSGTDTEDPSG